MQRDTSTGYYNVDQNAFPSTDSKQQGIDIMLVKDKKRMWRAIPSQFHFSHISADATDNTYNQSTITSIQRANQGVHPLGLKNTYRELLDNNELEK